MFLKVFKKFGNREIVCEKMEISAHSVARWLREDEDFRKEYDVITETHLSFMNGAAINSLKTAIIRGEPWAIKKQLESNHEGYMTKPTIAWLRKYSPNLLPESKFTFQEFSHISQDSFRHISSLLYQPEIKAVQRLMTGNDKDKALFASIYKTLDQEDSRKDLKGSLKNEKGKKSKKKNPASKKETAQKSKEKKKQSSSSKKKSSTSKSPKK